jgi:hypothetical protein
MTLPMTRIPGVADKSSVLPGMAWYSGTGPQGTTCGTCVHRRTHIPTRCMKFQMLTGKFGPMVRAFWYSCRYYEERPKDGEPKQTASNPIKHR